MKSPSVSTGVIADALACLPRAGIDPQAVLQRLNLPSGEALDAEAFGRLWREIARLTDDEFFGLAARPMRAGSFALMCQAAISAPTLAIALRRILTFMAVVLDDPRGRLTIANGLAVITLSDKSHRTSAFGLRSYWLIVMGVLNWLAGRRMPIVALHFACHEPPDRPEYNSFFGVPVQFGSPETKLVIDAQGLRQPSGRDDAALRRFLRAAPGNILTRQHEAGAIATHIQHHLAARAPSEWPNLPDLATELHMSPATLRRRLRAEGFSFAQLRDARRARLACALLTAGDASIADIALELGYSEPSAFYRAFQKWYGSTPAAWRSVDII